MDLVARKRELRRRVRELRREVDPSTADDAGVAVAEAIAGTIEFRAAPALALYAALPDELPTDALFDRAVAADKPCFLPRCMPETRLDFIEMDGWESLLPGRYGVREPSPDLAAGALPSGSLVIVPGVAFDLAGNRLGQGMGYYDRAFRRDDGRSLVLFGVGFELQLVEKVPVGAFDRRLDAIVTEQGISRVPSVST